jgi:hypothetical protein
MTGDARVANILALAGMTLPKMRNSHGCGCFSLLGLWLAECPGPDYRAVLVPAGQDNGLTVLAPFCGITIIQMRVAERYMQASFHPSLPSESVYGSGIHHDWHERLPISRYQIPEYVSDVIAGKSAPTQLTKWKIGAMKLAILLENTGYLTRLDFKRHQIDIRRWIAERWIVGTAEGWVAADRFPKFKVQHPVVWDQIVADVPKWRRVDALMIVGKK